jgi:hypothetical protein
MAPAEVAERTGRALGAVYDRRRTLELPDGRRERWRRQGSRRGRCASGTARRVAMAPGELLTRGTVHLAPALYPTALAMRCLATGRPPVLLAARPA